jgi:hypothetical protein
VFVACRRRGWQVAVGFVGQLPRGILGPTQLCLRGTAVEDWGEHIVRCVNPIQMSLFLPFRNGTGTAVGLGGGRARSPGVAQRPTAARNADR